MLSFTAQHTATGIIHAEPAVDGLVRGYGGPTEVWMPSRCEAVYLTIEVFAATAALSANALEELDDTVRIWCHGARRSDPQLRAKALTILQAIQAAFRSGLFTDKQRR